ncbi:hypothetical protein [Bradyrhizobium sp. McL0616]|uniref:ATP-dependent DNA ligase n=1 Tax=Bradyrhizobium sp. McL0616 TaxID=3415674 RepID=UPI003CF4C614
MVDAAARLKAQSFLIDGEAVIPREDGTSDFHALRSQRRTHEAMLYAFDLIERDGDDLRDLTLIERKRRLKRLIGRRIEGDQQRRTCDDHQQRTNPRYRRPRSACQRSRRTINRSGVEDSAGGTRDRKPVVECSGIVDRGLAARDNALIDECAAHLCGRYWRKRRPEDMAVLLSMMSLRPPRHDPIWRVGASQAGSPRSHDRPSRAAAATSASTSSVRFPARSGEPSPGNTYGFTTRISATAAASASGTTS